MTSKIKLKLGSIEVEYEGSEEFLKQELPTLLRGIIDLYRESGDSETKVSSSAKQAASKGEQSGSAHLDLSVGTIASRLGVSTGPDLVVAACASLTFVKKQESFDRKAILNEMKHATAFYK